MTGLAFSLFEPSALLYALMVVVIAYVALFIPSMMVTGAKADGVARAISCYLWKTFGLVLIGMSVVQLTNGVMMGQLPDAPLLSALILLFVLGIGIMTHMSRVLANIDHASAMVPRLVFSHTIELIGGLIALVAAVSVMVGFLITQQLDMDGWQMPVTMILLGITMMLSASLHITHKNKHANKAAKRKK